MQAIIDLSSCKYYQKKLSGLSILFRNILNLSIHGVTRFILISTDPNEFKALQKSILKYSKINKTHLVEIMLVPDFKSAISKSIMDSLIIIDDFYIIKEKFAPPENLSIPHKYYEGFYVVPYNALKEINKPADLFVLDMNAKVKKSAICKIKNKDDLKIVSKRIYEQRLVEEEKAFTLGFKRYTSSPLTKAALLLKLSPLIISLTKVLLITLSVHILWLYKNIFAIPLLASIYFFTYLLDSVDGEIARLKMIQSRLGSLIDCITDELRTIIFFSGVSYYVAKTMLEYNNALLLPCLATAMFLVSKFSQYLILSDPGGEKAKSQNILLSFIENRNKRKWYLRADKKMFNNAFTTIMIMLGSIVYVGSTDIGFIIYAYMPHIYFILSLMLFIIVTIKLFYYYSMQKLRNDQYKNVNTVIFDWDGTLLPTMENFADIAAKVLNKYYGMDLSVARRRYIETSGLPFEQQIRTIVPGGEKNQVCVDDFEETKLKPFFDEKFSDDVHNSLIKIKKMGFKICISSGNYQHLLEEFIKRENLDFDIILGFHKHLAKGKEHFDYIINKLGVYKKNVLFCGDSLKDGEKAFEYGVKFIGRTGIFSKTDFQKRFKDIRVIDKISELAKLLRKIKE